MDIWTLGNKASLLFYLIAASYFMNAKATPWDVLAYLVYLCLNVAIPIFKGKRPRLALMAVSAAFVVYCGEQLSPLFYLLLPVQLCESFRLAGFKRGWELLPMLLPLAVVPRGFVPVYGLAALFSFLLHAGLREQGGKAERLENELEKSREELQRLARSLNENEEYIRQSEYTIKLEERNRLSQRIHDEIGHSMAGALIQMEAARTLLGLKPDKAAELLGNAISISQDGLERIRLTLKDMKPKAEELGIHRLRLLADELSARHGGSVTATVTHAGDLDVITPIQWRIIQENATEAVTNSLKYSKATAIDIEVRVLNRFIKSVVADNGRGAPKIVKGLGIIGMEERSASAGGTVIADGTNGFSITTLLPRSDGTPEPS
ncbi:sensor histidine kinase [Cohnella sp. CBP 2801]|uniref:histidine kinase n=1 Tax=Cohnella zeiphila TaxID=2761120 RepID=A0A7X0SLB8_9BACL|nr:sensor histidine kinase [Cohnella zeiphila]